MAQSDHGDHDGNHYDADAFAFAFASASLGSRAVGIKSSSKLKSACDSSFVPGPSPGPGPGPDSETLDTAAYPRLVVRSRFFGSPDSGSTSTSHYSDQLWHHYSASELHQPFPAVRIPVTSHLQFVHVSSSDGGPGAEDRKLIRAHAAAGHGLKESHERRLARARSRRAINRAKERQQKHQQQYPDQLSDSDAGATEYVGLFTRKDDSEVTVTERTIRAFVAGESPGDEFSPYSAAFLSNPLFLSPCGVHSKVDPFDSLPINIYSPWMDMVLRAFFARWIIDVPELDSPGSPRAYTAKHWRSIQSHAASLAAHLLLCAGIMDMIRKHAGDRLKVLELKSKTLSHVNKCIANDDYSDEVLAAIISLCNFEDICGQKEELVAHLAGLKQMVAHRGGLDKLKPYTKRMIVFIDASLAQSSNILRSFPQHPDDDVFRNHKCTAPDSLLLQHGFKCLIEAGKLEQDLVNRLRQFQLTFGKLRKTYGSSLWNDSVTHQEWIVTESKLDVMQLRSNLEYGSRYYDRPAANIRKGLGYDMDELTRIAALTLFYLLRQRCLAKLDRRPRVEENIQSMTKHIPPSALKPHHDSWFTDEYDRLLWWVFSVTTFATPYPPARLRDLLLVMRERLKISNEAASFAVLSDFFFCKKMFRVDHARMWQWILVG